jgi:hypothetical protein
LHTLKVGRNSEIPNFLKSLVFGNFSGSA